MAKLSDTLNNKVIPVVMRFVNTRPITAMKNGMLYPIPFIIVGAIFLILGQFPYQPVAAYFTKIGIDDWFMQAYHGSFAIMALFAVFGITYSWVHDSGYDGVPAGLLAIVTDIILQPNHVTTVANVLDKTKTSTNWMAENAIDKAWLGGKGMILAIIIGMLVGWIYTWFMKKGITIKLPEQVPSNVAASFTALVPAAAIITGATIVYGLFQKLGNTTFAEWIYRIIQTPLQHASDGPFGVLLITLVPVFLWFFGVHGSTIVSGIMQPLLISNNADNLTLYQAGKLSLDNGAHIVTQSFFEQFITVTGAGVTIGLVVYMIIGAKSVQMKTLAKLEIGPGLFNINEPVLFGIPLVLNPVMVVPFILAPVVTGFSTYYAIKFGIIPPLNGVYVPWTTPPVISGFIVGGWKVMLWQIFMLAITIPIYWPFAQKYDKILVAQEKAV